MKTSFCTIAALGATAPLHAQVMPAGQAAPIVVTATRGGGGVALDRLPASATLLDAQTIADRQTRLVGDILRDVPGLAVNRSGGAGDLTQVRIRGSEANHVLVLIDGIEAADPFQGEYDFGTLLADPGSRIEVLRGQQSALYGSDAIGGVIQVLTPTGREAPGTQLRVEGGSLGTRSAGARVGGVAGALDYALSGSYFGTGGSITARGGSRRLGTDIASGSAKLALAVGDRLVVSAVVRATLGDTDINSSDADPASATFGLLIDSPGTHARTDAVQGLLRAAWASPGDAVRVSASAQAVSARRRNFTPSGLDFGDRGQRFKASVEGGLRFRTGAAEQHLIVAVDAERERYRNLTPSPGVFQGMRDADNVGIVGQYRLAVGRLDIGASLRHDSNNRFADVTTGRLAAGYALPTGTRLRAAYGSGVKNPGFFELYGYDDGRYIGNPGLRPERSTGWEIGAEQRIGNKATLGLTWFGSRLEDEIFTTYPAPDYVATPSNRTTLSRQHGIEAFASARPIPQIRLDAAYTWTRAREDGATEVRRPNHIGSVAATVTSPDARLSGTATLRYNGRQADDAFTDPSYVPVRVSLQEYVLVNLAADYRISDRIALYARVENVTRERYEEVFGVVGAPRSAVAGVRLAL